MRAAQLAWLLTHDRDRVDDIVQESFTAVYDRFDTLDRPDAYLTTTIINVVRGQHRRSQRSERRIRLVEPRGGTERVDDHADDRLIDIIARLPERERTAIVLRYWADLPDEDIAVVLGVRRATVRSLVHRALKRLRGEIHL